MATHAGRLIQDQNLNIHYNGAPFGEKTNVSKSHKKEGLAGRKALNDISNSGKPSALQATKKPSVMKVIPIPEDLGVEFSAGGKKSVTKAPEKSKLVGRKPLSDLTNSRMPSVHQVPKKSQTTKLSVVAEEKDFPATIAQEGFLHNHQECIKAQRKVMDLDYFLKTVGLNDASPGALPSPGKLEPENSSKLLEKEAILELMVEDDIYQYGKAEARSEENSPICGSPNSPMAFMHWKDSDFPEFMLMEEIELP
ncbi:hypothetical protein RJ639_009366 [Escallonia herrerae]|uniref:Uncharacterized protein n=1 Tax=Escallonia herrerae TaxID=1293975 RepID=A0AA88VSU2_9ASTE|nr:hypothetical protein RJ639_009366 [Escallonia herrerae]